MRTQLLLVAAASVGALALAPGAAAAALPGGDYDFNLPGLKPIDVKVEEIDFESIKLLAPSGSTIPMTVNRRGDRYTGLVHDPHGAMCSGQPMLADVFYSVDLDGMNGVVEVLGQPCGPGTPIAPLIFTMTPNTP